jgi:hypothetical protein
MESGTTRTVPVSRADMKHENSMNEYGVHRRMLREILLFERIDDGFIFWMSTTSESGS